MIDGRCGGMKTVYRTNSSDTLSDILLYQRDVSRNNQKL